MMHEKIEAAVPAVLTSATEMQIEASQVSYNIENARQMAGVALDKFVEIERYLKNHHSEVTLFAEWSTIKALLNVVDDQLEAAFNSCERIELAVVVTGLNRPS